MAVRWADVWSVSALMIEFEYLDIEDIVEMIRTLGVGPSVILVFWTQP